MAITTQYVFIQTINIYYIYHLLLKEKTMQKITIFISLLGTMYAYNIISMNPSPTFNAKYLQTSKSWVIEFTLNNRDTYNKDKTKLDQTNFVDKPRKVPSPQCLYCERILDEKNTVYKCDACRNTRINVILTQRFPTKIDKY